MDQQGYDQASYARSQQQYAQQQYAQDQYAQQQHPYAQPQYAQPGFAAPGAQAASAKHSALPWIIVGGVGVLIAIIVAVALSLTLIGRGGKAAMVAAPTEFASFQYPADWTEQDSNVTYLNEDGSKPAEHFVALKKPGKSAASAMVVYEAGSRPQSEVTEEKIHAAIDQGLAGQLAASQAELVYYRGTAALGCAADFNYTLEPSTVERDGLYGYSYGYTCQSYNGPIEGIYLVAYDMTGVSHRLTVEALQSEWDDKSSTAIVDSLKPVS